MVSHVQRHQRAQVDDLGVDAVILQQTSAAASDSTHAAPVADEGDVATRDA